MEVFSQLRINDFGQLQTLSHDDADSPKKNKLRSLRRSPYSSQWITNHTSLFGANQ